MSPEVPANTNGRVPKRTLEMRGRARLTDTTGVSSWPVKAVASATPEARAAQVQQHQHEVAQVDGIKLGKLAVIARPTGSQLRCRLRSSRDDSLAPRRGRIAHGRPFWLDCTAKSFMLRRSI